MKLLPIFLFALIIMVSFAEDSETSNMAEYRMFGRYLNHTNWDGVTFPIIKGLNNYTYDLGFYSSFTEPIIFNGSIYAYSYNSGANEYSLLQLNASNITQLLSSYNFGSTGTQSGITVTTDYIYFTDWNGIAYQLNTSNVSQLVHTNTFDSDPWTPLVYNGNAYFIGTDGVVYQVDATDISTVLHTFTPADSGGGATATGAIANGYLYYTHTYTSGGNQYFKVYQLDANDVSSLTNTYGPINDLVYSSLAVYNGYVYVAQLDFLIRQLDATTLTLSHSRSIANGVEGSFAIDNGAVYLGTLDGKVQQLDAADVSSLLTSSNTGGNIWGGATTTSTYMYMDGGDNNFYQYDAADVSTIINTFYHGATHTSTAALTDQYIYFVDSDGILHQLNAQNISLGNAFVYVSLNQPTNNSFTNSTSIEFNWTCWGSFTSYNANLTIDDVLNTSDILTLNNTPTTQIINDFTEGTHNWSIYCYNATGWEVSENRTFSVDLTPPSVTLDEPINTTYIGSAINLNLTTSDALSGINTSSCFYTLNGVPTTIPSCNNLSIPLSDGFYSINVTVFDNAGNSNTSYTINFTLLAPLLNVTITGGNSSILDGQNASVNYQISNNAPYGVSCNYTLDAVTTDIGNFTGNNTGTLTLAGLGIGDHSVFMTCGNATAGLPDINSNTFAIHVYNGSEVAFACYDEILEYPKPFSLHIYSENASVIVTNLTTNYTVPAILLQGGMKKLYATCQNGTTRLYLWTNGTYAVDFYSLNTWQGQYYYFYIKDTFGNPLQGAVLTAYRWSDSKQAQVVVEQGLTDITGYTYLFLEPQYPYRMTLVKDGYLTMNFDFVPLPDITNANIIMTPNTTDTMPDAAHMLDGVEVSLTPTAYQLPNQSTNITYTVIAGKADLESYGMTVYEVCNNGTTTVYNNTVASSSGGLVYYEVNGTSQCQYQVEAFIKKQNQTAIYYPIMTYQGGGVVREIGIAINYLSQFLTGPNPMLSPWFVYLIFVFLAMLAGGFLSRYTFEGASFVSVLVLVLGTVLLNGITILEVGNFVIQSWHLTGLTILMTVGIMYLMNQKV